MEKITQSVSSVLFMLAYIQYVSGEQCKNATLQKNKAILKIHARLNDNCLWNISSDVINDDYAVVLTFGGVQIKNKNKNGCPINLMLPGLEGSCSYKEGDCHMYVTEQTYCNLDELQKKRNCRHITKWNGHQHIQYNTNAKNYYRYYNFKLKYLPIFCREPLTTTIEATKVTNITTLHYTTANHIAQPFEFQLTITIVLAVLGLAIICLLVGCIIYKCRRNGGKPALIELENVYEGELPNPVDENKKADNSGYVNFDITTNEVGYECPRNGKMQYENLQDQHQYENFKDDGQYENLRDNNDLYMVVNN